MLDVPHFPFRSLRKQAENSPSDIWDKTPAKSGFLCVPQNEPQKHFWWEKRLQEPTNKLPDPTKEVPESQTSDLQDPTQFNPCMQVLYMPCQFSIKKQSLRLDSEDPKFSQYTTMVINSVVFRDYGGNETLGHLYTSQRNRKTMDMQIESPTF